MPVIKLDYVNSKMRDTSVYSSNADTNYSTSNGLGIGLLNGGNYRSLLKFDLGLIPNNAVINSATLALTTANTSVTTLKQHLITDNYDETTVTWNSQPGYDAIAYPTTAINVGSNVILNLDIKDVLQKIVNGNGYGILLENDDGGYDNFHSLEATTTAYRPTLTIDYMIPTTDKKQVEFIDKSSAYSASTSTVTIPITSNKNAGDMLVAYILTTGGSTSAMTVPAGWTALSLNEIIASTNCMSVLYKVSDGTESTFSAVLSVSTQYLGSIHIYRNVKAIHNHGAIKIASGSNLYPNVPTDLLPNSLFILFNAVGGTVSGTPPLSFLEELDTNVSFTTMVSHSYNHSKTTYLSTELTTAITSSSYSAGSKAISLEPITNEAPHIDGTDEDLGALSAALSKSYTVTDTEGDTITVTEKLNGTTIRTYQGSGAQTLDLSAQWASLPVGKHTVTIEANDDYANPPHTPTVRTWTFLKILPNTATLIESVQGLQQVVPYLQSQKAMLASVLRSNGFTVNDTDRLEDMAKQLGASNITKTASGSVVCSTTNTPYTYLGGTSVNLYPVTVTGIPFKPSLIFVYTSQGNFYCGIYMPKGWDTQYAEATVKTFNVGRDYGGVISNIRGDSSNIVVTDTAFSIPIAVGFSAGTVVNWVIFG